MWFGVKWTGWVDGLGTVEEGGGVVVVVVIGWGMGDG